MQKIFLFIALLHFGSYQKINYFFYNLKQILFSPAYMVRWTNFYWYVICTFWIHIDYVQDFVEKHEIQISSSIWDGYR